MKKYKLTIASQSGHYFNDREVINADSFFLALAQAIEIFQREQLQFDHIKLFIDGLVCFD